MDKTCITEGCPLKNLMISRPVKFCSRCGKELAEAKKCEYCEHTVYPKDKFCEFCGRSCL